MVIEKTIKVFNCLYSPKSPTKIKYKDKSWFKNV